MYQAIWGTVSVLKVPTDVEQQSECQACLGVAVKKCSVCVSGLTEGGRDAVTTEEPARVWRWWQ